MRPSFFKRRENAASSATQQAAVSWTPPSFAPSHTARPSAKTCGHECELALSKCCNCSDRRPHQNGYKKYQDGHGFTNTATRSEYYCPACKRRLEQHGQISEPPSSQRTALRERQIPIPPPPPRVHVPQDLRPLLNMGFSADSIVAAQEQLPRGSRRRDVNAVLEVLLSGAVAAPLPPAQSPIPVPSIPPPPAPIITVDEPGSVDSLAHKLPVVMDLLGELSEIEEAAALRYAQSPLPVAKETPPAAASESGTVLGACVICCDRTVNALIYPCGHLGFCMQCANDTVQKTKMCPICRKSVHAVVHVYPV